MEENVRPILLTRKQLYDEVWSISVTGVAKKYSLSYPLLLKQCRENNIPIPESGYWAKLSRGKPVEQPLLTGNEEETIMLLPIGEKIPRQKKAAKEPKHKQPTAPDTSSVSVQENKGTRQPALEVNKVLNANNEPIENHTEQAKTAVVRDDTVSNGGDKLSFLTEEKRVAVFEAARSIKLPASDMQPLRKLTAHKTVVKEWNKKNDRAEGSEKRPQNYSNHPPFLAGVISEETLPRVLRILDALYRQIEILGGTINKDLSLTIRGERVTLLISEAQDKVPHVLTKPEAQAQLKYIDDKRRGYQYATEPKFRKYDYVFNGKLCLSIHTGIYYRDSGAEIIEDRLGDILIKLIEESEYVRIARLKREEQERLDEIRRQEEAVKREEEAKRKEERRQRYNKEVENTIALVNMADDYQIACRIRALLEAWKLKSDLSEEEEEKIQWASIKADWFDPVISREDEVFGVREHEKAQKEKTLEKSYGYYGW